MKNSRLVLILLTLAAVALTGFATAEARAAKDQKKCCADCSGDCHKCCGQGSCSDQH